MERYMWSFDGKKHSNAKAAIPFTFGERLRLVLVNDTMMEQSPFGRCWSSRKHVLSVRPESQRSTASDNGAVR